MAVFRVHSSRGAVLIWRQSDPPPVPPGTAAPRLRWQLVARGASVAFPQRGQVAAAGGGTTVAVPSASLSLTGFIPTVNVSADVPTLSAATVFNITATTARPRVTVTF